MILIRGNGVEKGFDGQKYEKFSKPQQDWGAE